MRPSCRASRRRRARGRRCTCCRPRGGAGRAGTAPSSQSASSVDVGARPISATRLLPAWRRPGETTSPTLRPWNVTVSTAFTASVATSPVEASTPEGRSIASTLAPEPLIRSISARGFGSRLAGKTGAEERVDDHLADRRDRVSPAFASTILTCSPAASRCRAAIAAVAAVRSAAADECPALGVGEDLKRHLCRSSACALHQHIARRGRPRPRASRPRCTADRSQTSVATATAAQARANASSTGRSRGRRGARRRRRPARTAGRRALDGRRSRSPSTRRRALLRSRALCRPPLCPRSGRRSSPRGSRAIRSTPAPPQ